MVTAISILDPLALFSIVLTLHYFGDDLNLYLYPSPADGDPPQPGLRQRALRAPPDRAPGLRLAPSEPYPGSRWLLAAAAFHKSDVTTSGGSEFPAEPHSFLSCKWTLCSVGTT